MRSKQLYTVGILSEMRARGLIKPGLKPNSLLFKGSNSVAVFLFQYNGCFGLPFHVGNTYHVSQERCVL